MNDVAPCDRSDSIAFATLGSARALNSFSRMYPTLPPSSLEATGLTALLLRRKVTSRVGPAPGSPASLRMVTFTSGPGEAWMRLTAWNALLFLTSTPSTATTSSPCFTPALAAGESSTSPNTLSLVESSGSSATFMPTPLMSYLSNGAKSEGSTNLENGSPNVRRMLLIVSYASSLSAGGDLTKSSRSLAHAARSNPSTERAGRKLSSTTFHTSSTIWRSVSSSDAVELTASAFFSFSAADSNALDARSSMSSSACAAGTPTGTASNRVEVTTGAPIRIAAAAAVDTMTLPAAPRSIASGSLSPDDPPSVVLGPAPVALSPTLALARVVKRPRGVTAVRTFSRPRRTHRPEVWTTRGLCAAAPAKGGNPIADVRVFGGGL
mmetsp:Transcript_10400/g.45135  ORF Transcript_10400/g.45135 Transcript_10400/m.45135 type:complete len:380 (+) Transcript_10400:1418-2557(+)